MLNSDMYVCVYINVKDFCLYKSIIPKINIIVRLGFELTYSENAVQYFRHDTMVIPVEDS